MAEWHCRICIADHSASLEPAYRPIHAGFSLNAAIDLKRWGSEHGKNSLRESHPSPTKRFEALKKDHFNFRRLVHLLCNFMGVTASCHIVVSTLLWRLDSMELGIKAYCQEMFDRGAPSKTVAKFSSDLEESLRLFEALVAESEGMFLRHVTPLSGLLSNPVVSRYYKLTFGMLVLVMVMCWLCPFIAKLLPSRSCL